MRTVRRCRWIDRWSGRWHPWRKRLPHLGWRRTGGRGRRLEWCLTWWGVWWTLSDSAQSEMRAKQRRTYLVDLHLDEERKRFSTCELLSSRDKIMKMIQTDFLKDLVVVVIVYPSSWWLQTIVSFSFIERSTFTHANITDFLAVMNHSTRAANLSATINVEGKSPSDRDSKERFPCGKCFSRRCSAKFDGMGFSLVNTDQWEKKSSGWSHHHIFLFPVLRRYEFLR